MALNVHIPLTEKIFWLLGLLVNIVAFVLLVVIITEASREGGLEATVKAAIGLSYVLLNTYFVLRARPGLLEDTLLGLWIAAKKANLRQQITPEKEA